MSFWEEVMGRMEEMDRNPLFRLSVYFGLIFGGVLCMIASLGSSLFLFIIGLLCWAFVAIDIIVRYKRNRPRW